MDAGGCTEKSFHYVLRAPSSDGLDIVNVDLKIHTAWLFQDTDGTQEGQETLPEGVVNNLGVDTGTLREQLESSEQKLLAARDKHMVSESGLRNRIQALELSEQRLLRKVDRLSAWVVQERSASLQAQRQLEALQGELHSQVREQECMARRLRESLRRRDEALGRQAAALERGRRTQRRQLGLSREQERELRSQVRRLECYVRRLCGAAGRLLAELDAPALPGSHSVATEDAAVRKRREQRATERGLHAQLEELRCCVYELKLSEIDLQGQVEDLAEQNQSLREELDAQVSGERACGMLPAGQCSRDPLDCIQDEFLPLLREEALDSSHDCSRPLSLDEAGGHKISAGQVTEGPCTRAKQFPPVLVTGPETLSVLLGDLTGSECEQLVLTVPPLESFLLLCSCAPVQCVESSLQSSEQNPATTSASGPFTLTQTSSPLLQGSIEKPAPLPLLLIPEPSPEAQRIQEGLGARPLLSPEFVRHCCRDHRQTWGSAELHEESPPIPNAGCPGGGLMKTLTEGVTLPGWSVEQSGAGRSLVCPTSKCPWHPETPGALVSAHKPQSETARLGGPSGPEGSPLSFSGKVGVRGQAWDRLGGLWSEEEVSPSATLSRAHRTEETSQPGGQLWAEKDGAGGRGEEGKEEKQVCAGQAEHLWEGQEEGQHQVGAGPGGMDVLESLPVNGCDGRDTLCLMEEQDCPQSANGSWAPGTDGDWYLNEIDALEGEMAACIQHLSTLPVQSWGVRRQTSRPAGENWSFAHKWPSLEDGAHASHASVSYTVDVCAAEEETAPEKVDKKAVLGRAGSLGAWGMPPRAVPRPDSMGLEQDWLSGALEQVRTRCNLLFTHLRNKRSSVPWGVAQGDQEGSHWKVQTLEREQERQEQRVSDLQQDNSRLSAAVAHLQTEVDQYLQLISDLEDCNRKSYLRISKLDEEKEVLQRKLAQTKWEMSESRQRAQGMLEHALRENTQIWTLVSELRTSYKGLIQDIVLGMEDVTQGLQAQNMRLLCRVQMLEQMTMTEVYPNMGSGEIRGQCSQVGAVDKAVQVAQLLGHKPASIQGPSWDEDMGQGGVRGHSPSGTEQPGISANPTALLPTWGNVSTSGVLSGNVGRAGVKETGVNTEERGPRCSGNHRRELWGVDTKATEEELRLRVGQLHHQVLTLKCRLRDQGSLHRELQESQKEAGRLRDQLHNQREEFQNRQHEADLAATPLKAKVASLVRKCQERNGLITHLLRELQRHGAASLPLAECAQSMVADEALTQYAATFLTTGVQEMPECDTWTSPAGGAVEPGVCAQSGPDTGRKPFPALHTDDSFPAPSELLSPARILALHKELRQSVCIHSRVNKSPLDVQL